MVVFGRLDDQSDGTALLPSIETVMTAFERLPEGVRVRQRAGAAESVDGELSGR